MAKKFARAFYDSAAWKKCRASYIARRIAIDGGICEKCQDDLGYIVHHKKTLTPENISDPEVALNHELLRYDCKRCHDGEENHFVIKSPLRVIFAENGDVLPPMDNGKRDGKQPLPEL